MPGQHVEARVVGRRRGHGDPHGRIPRGAVRPERGRHVLRLPVAVRREAALPFGGVHAPGQDVAVEGVGARGAPAQRARLPEQVPHCVVHDDEGGRPARAPQRQNRRLQLGHQLAPDHCAPPPRPFFRGEHRVPFLRDVRRRLRCSLCLAEPERRPARQLRRQPPPVLVRSAVPGGGGGPGRPPRRRPAAFGSPRHGRGAGAGPAGLLRRRGLGRLRRRGSRPLQLLHT